MLMSCSWTPTTRKPHPISLRFGRKTTRTRPRYTCTKLSGKAVRTEILELAPKYDHTIVDTGGRDTTSQRAALAVSQLFACFPLFPAASISGPYTKSPRSSKNCAP